ncbi:hypothetical protein BRADI_4g17955v3 [Brachypodium distachyon]|uniref:Uncharacterized protein n=1 Tax=Brachypodium distachyon TaxID=15368 RepID=A0A2K2CNI1_BRADI|nr:hypothetical protein BRADI_4g17955v3 [Brachypodium distachyon]
MWDGTEPNSLVVRRVEDDRLEERGQQSEPAWERSEVPRPLGRRPRHREQIGSQRLSAWRIRRRPAAASSRAAADVGVGTPRATRTMTLARDGAAGRPTRSRVSLSSAVAPHFLPPNIHHPIESDGQQQFKPRVSLLCQVNERSSGKKIPLRVFSRKIEATQSLSPSLASRERVGSRLRRPPLDLPALLGRSPPTHTALTSSSCNSSSLFQSVQRNRGAGDDEAVDGDHVGRPSHGERHRARRWPASVAQRCPAAVTREAIARKWSAAVAQRRRWTVAWRTSHAVGGASASVRGESLLTAVALELRVTPARERHAGAAPRHGPATAAPPSPGEPAGGGARPEGSGSRRISPEALARREARWRRSAMAQQSA